MHYEGDEDSAGSSEYRKAAVRESHVDSFNDGSEPAPQRRKVSAVSLLKGALDALIPGLGMFCNAYILLAVGTNAEILSVSHPECWGPHPKECSVSLRHACKFSVFIGVIMGMLSGGYVADHFGRKKGSLITVVTMFLGAMIVVSSVGRTEEAQFWMYAAGLCVFGLGLGGEYPLAAASTAEKAEAQRKRRLVTSTLRHPLVEEPSRGRNVQLTLTMQGLGNVTNILILIALLAIFGQTQMEYSTRSLDVIWRLHYAIGCVMLLILLTYRFKYLEESAAWMILKKQASKAQKFRRLFLKHFWHRLLGTFVCWFMWDVAFYGNLMFQTEFIRVFAPDASIFTISLWTLANLGIGVLGYLTAAFTIDRQWMGRRRMQIMGFAVNFVLYSIASLWSGALDTPRLRVALQALYYATTFFGQWGPNATTYLFPSEIFPTQVRGVAHGISAAGGKLGALTATVLFNHLLDSERFALCASSSLMGLVVTMLLLPDVTRMPLQHVDEFWSHAMSTQQGQETEPYVGPYSEKQNVSPIELCLGSCKRRAAQQSEAAQLIGRGSPIGSWPSPANKSPSSSTEDELPLASQQRVYPLQSAFSVQLC